MSEPPDPEGRRRTLAEMEPAISDPRPEDDAPEAMRVLGVLAREKGWAEDDIADWLGRFYRYRRLRAKAEDVLGTSKAADWLKSPNRALGGANPLSLLDTSDGARDAEDVLGRIDHGVFE